LEEMPHGFVSLGLSWRVADPKATDDL